MDGKYGKAVFKGLNIASVNTASSCTNDYLKLIDVTTNLKVQIFLTFHTHVVKKKTVTVAIVSSSLQFQKKFFNNKFCIYACRTLKFKQIKRIQRPRHTTL